MGTTHLIWWGFFGYMIAKYVSNNGTFCIQGILISYKKYFYMFYISVVSLLFFCNVRLYFIITAWFLESIKLWPEIIKTFLNWQGGIQKKLGVAERRSLLLKKVHWEASPVCVLGSFPIKIWHMEDCVHTQCLFLAQTSGNDLQQCWSCSWNGAHKSSKMPLQKEFKIETPFL